MAFIISENHQSRFSYQILQNTQKSYVLHQFMAVFRSCYIKTKWRLKILNKNMLAGLTVYWSIPRSIWKAMFRRQSTRGFSKIINLNLQNTEKKTSRIRKLKEWSNFRKDQKTNVGITQKECKGRSEGKKKSTQQFKKVKWSSAKQYYKIRLGRWPIKCWSYLYTRCKRRNAHF